MAFCRFSSSYIIDDKTIIDNVFINDHLPYAPELCVKVYLMGLSKCGNAAAGDNNIENFAKVLNVTVEEIENAFKYWQEEGLVQILSTRPMEVVYLPVKLNAKLLKKFNVDKYADFNHQLQEILVGRMINPSEYNVYYSFIEENHIEPEVLIMIVKYCVQYKGNNARNVHYPYIMAIARNWLDEGVRTTEDVENKIQSLGVMNDKATLLLTALNTKRKVQLEDVQLLNKWLDELDFDFNVIIYVAKRMSMKKRVDVQVLNNQLLKYYEMKLSSINEIEDYENDKQSLYDIAKAVVKNLGLYYEDLSKIIETYVLKWQQMGYTKDVLVDIADYSFKNSIRTLDGFDSVVQKLYKLGIVTTDALNEYLIELNVVDQKIATILELLGLKRNVNSFDRNYYKTWTEDWNFNDEMLQHACNLSAGKTSAIQYMNKILSNWKQQNVYTIEKAQATSLSDKQPEAPKADISKERMSALFGNIEFVDV